MSITFLVIPQWQGSGSTRALQLKDGTEAIRGDLPSSKSVSVEVPLGAGESLGSGIRRFSAIQAVRDGAAEALSHTTDTVIAIGGDCGVELAPVEHAHSRYPDELALVWFDAHPDVNSPESSTTGAFHGMVLRTVTGDGFSSLVPEHPIRPERVILAGVRAFDDPEAEWAAEHEFRMIPPTEFGPDAVVSAVEETGARAVYIHVDLDVLDPAEFGSLGFPEPFGIGVDALLESIRALVDRFELAGAGICEFAPPTPESATDDLPTILRIIAAITS